MFAEGRAAHSNDGDSIANAVACHDDSPLRLTRAYVLWMERSTNAEGLALASALKSYEGDLVEKFLVAARILIATKASQQVFEGCVDQHERGHAHGWWAKKIRGKLHYFGRWDGPDGSWQQYPDQRGDLHAGAQVPTEW